MSEQKWNIESDQVGAHTIEYNGQQVSGVRAIRYAANAFGVPEVLLVVNPHRFNLSGEFNARVEVVPCCLDCKQELRKSYSPQFGEHIFIGCICEFKE